ncbi:MAG: sigma-54-dependent transcriptional regulator [Bacteroidia bacterium]
MARLLVIDDDPDIRLTLADILSHEYVVETAADGNEAQKVLSESDFDLVLCDVRMPGKDGLELLRWARQTKPETEFIMLSGHGNLQMAVEAVRIGAFDFLEKPPDLARIEIALRNALERRKLRQENRQLSRKFFVRDILGQSPAIQEVRALIDKIAPTESRVLILGPSGAGKELVARWIHHKSPRAKGPFIEVNCAAIPSELIESELFGHERGSFTDATRQHIGKFEQAQGGTIFLDEISDMSLNAQAKVLRVLQENRLQRIGGNKDIPINVRVIAATNKNLAKEIAEGRFREDLYHRISTVIIEIPSLKERREDIPILVQAFWQEIIQQYKYAKHLTPEAIDILTSLEWRGNVREIRNAVERLAILSGDKVTAQDVKRYVVHKSLPITAPSLEANLYQLADETSDMESFMQEVQKKYLEYKLSQHDYNVTHTAQAIRIARSVLHTHMKRLGIRVHKQAKTS